MLNKKYTPSIGFIILITTLLFSVLFIQWIVSPLSYDKAHFEENKGHNFAKNGQLKEALKHFLIAANIEDDNLSRSRRFRCAGSVSEKKKEKILYYKLALKFNPQNLIAQKALKSYSENIKR